MGACGRISSAWIVLVCAIVCAGCASSVVHTHEDVSRDYTWVRVAETKKPFRAEGLVGGEHITSYRLLGFQGERYMIESSGEELYLSIDSQGSAKVTRTDSEGVYEVDVVALDAMISIELSAHPVSDYRLVVWRLPTGDSAE